MQDKHTNISFTSGTVIKTIIILVVAALLYQLRSLALIVGAELAGFLGIILSVPAAATLQEFVKDLQGGTLPWQSVDV